ncbi:hypothetical protein TNCV_2424151 [Trichonephila clavipes]|nr:hypothetical protein TNCV_2424151 [Trichonephila clavipes]
MVKRNWIIARPAKRTTSGFSFNGIMLLEQRLSVKTAYAYHSSDTRGEHSSCQQILSQMGPRYQSDDFSFRMSPSTVARRDI